MNGSYNDEAVSLINVDISIDGIIIDWDSPDSDLIESAIVHILHNDGIIGHIRNNTDMSIVSIISTPRELYNRSRNWSRSYFYSCGFCIPHPLICISSP